MIDPAGCGKALFLLAEEEGTTDRILQELDVVQKALEENPSYVTLLDTPAVSTEEKLSLLREAFGGADPMLLNFLCLLCEKHAVHELPRCARIFGTCCDEARGILRATAITAVAMTEGQKTALCSKLARLTGKEIVLTNLLDPALIGGMTLRYGGVQLDDSIRSRLDRLHRSLSETIV